MIRKLTVNATRVFLIAPVFCLGGCFLAPGGLPAGTYSGEIPCVLELAGEAHDPVQEPFTAELVVEVGPSDSISINDVPVEVGSEHVRSIPNADLTFEVVEIVRSVQQVAIHYEPRPTLVGIEVTGELVETYRWNVDHLDALAEASLTLTDIDGSMEFLIDCEGELSSQTDNP